MTDLVRYTKLTLTFDIEKLLKQVQLRSIYATMPQEGNRSVTDAELDLANINLRNAAHDIYTRLQSLTRYNDVPFLYDTTIAGKRSILYELWMNENWDTNLKAALSVNIESALVNYCLSDWYKTTLQTGQYQAAFDEWERSLKSIKNNINARKEPVRRPCSIL